MTKTKSGETVGFSFITYKNKAHRDAVNRKVMKYMAEKYKDAKYEEMPFDMKKMCYGGFNSIVDL
jgi:alkaline phosphatase